MRYLDIDNIEYTDINGKVQLVKEMREYPEYQTLAVHNNLSGDDLDEVISRDQYYGDGTEDLTYTLFEHNREKIFENNFTIDNIKNINIPVV